MNRRGFTVIEMLFVMGTIAILAGMAVPAVAPALRRGRVNEAANLIVRLNSEARALARSSTLSNTDFYGVVVVNGEPSYAALTYGANASAATILTKNGKPVAKYEFNDSVVVYAGASSATATPISSIGWLYRYGSAYPSMSPSQPVDNPGWWCSVGVTGSPVCNSLSVRSLDGGGRYRSAISIYQIGVSHVAEF